jgi:hypothetical protein
MILGFPWLSKHNPIINWKNGQIEWMHTNKLPRPSIEEEEDEENWKNHTQNPVQSIDEISVNYIVFDKKNEVWICAKTNLAMDLAIEANSQKADLKPEDIIPKEYHEYLNIFDKEKANRFPDSQTWDHKIEMKPGFEPKLFKNYNLTPEEQKELDKFLKENLDKKYI